MWVKFIKPSKLAQLFRKLVEPMPEGGPEYEHSCMGVKPQDVRKLSRSISENFPPQDTSRDPNSP